MTISTSSWTSARSAASSLSSLPGTVPALHWRRSRALGAVIVALLVVQLNVTPALGKQTVKPSDKRHAVRILDSDIGACMSAIAKSSAGAKVRATSKRETGRGTDTTQVKPVIVTLTSGEAFIVHLKGKEPAAPFNQLAFNLLVFGRALGRVC